MVYHGFLAHIYLYIYGPVSRVPTPPHGMGGGMMPLWWCIYIHTYLHTYLPTYLRTYIHTITLPYLTLPYITLPYITLPYIPYIHTYIHRHTHTYIHACMHAYIHTYIHTHIHTYIHTNIPTYQHTTTTGHRGGPEEPYHHHRPQGGGPEEPYHHHRPQGGGPEEPDDTVHPYPLVGGGGVVANAAPYIIYIYMIYLYLYISIHIYIHTHEICSLFHSHPLSAIRLYNVIQLYIDIVTQFYPYLCCLRPIFG